MRALLRNSHREAARKRLRSLSSYSYKMRRRDHIAKGVIRAAAGVTISALVLIIGFIIVNGVFTRTTTDEPVLPIADELILTDSGREFVVVVSDELRLPTLSYDTLREIYGGELTYWGYETEQNLNVAAGIYSDPPFTDAVVEYAVAPNQTLSDRVVRLVSPAAVERYLDENDGAIVAVPPTIAEGLDDGQIVAVQQLSIVVHPDVVALQAGRRLDQITLPQLRDIFTGRAGVWGDVDGPRIEVDPADLSAGYDGVYDPLPIVPVILDREADSERGAASAVVEDAELAEQLIRVGSIEELRSVIAGTPGAIGIVRRAVGIDLDLPTLPVEHTIGRINLRPSFVFQPPSRAGAVGGISHIIVNTLVMIALVILIATPIGVSAAVYLAEYSGRPKLMAVLRVGIDTLAGIPSIIFGLFGMVFFAQFLGLKTGLISGTLTVTLMILPVIIRTSEDALRAVPMDFRFGSAALGASKLQTITRVVIRAAAPGILTGVVLSVGRAVGETAALLFTMGSNLALVRSINSPIRVMSIHLYLLIRETISVPKAFATASILVIIVFMVSFASQRLVLRLNRNTTV